MLEVICPVRRLGLAPRDHPEALQKRILLQWYQRPLNHSVTLADAFEMLLVRSCIDVFEGSFQKRKQSSCQSDPSSFQLQEAKIMAPLIPACGNFHELSIDDVRVHKWAPVSMMESPQIIKSGAPLAHHPVSDMQPSKVHNDSLNITVEGMLKPCKCRNIPKQKHLKRLRKVLRNPSVIEKYSACNKLWGVEAGHHRDLGTQKGDDQMKKMRNVKRNVQARF